MYSISADIPNRILHLQLSGFWTPETLASFKAELVTKAAAFRGRGGGFAVLSDASQFPVQSTDVARGFATVMSHGRDANPGPTAIVVASALNKLQAERTVQATRVRVFLKIEEARAWLVDEWSSSSKS